VASIASDPTLNLLLNKCIKSQQMLTLRYHSYFDVKILAINGIARELTGTYQVLCPDVVQKALKGLDNIPVVGNLTDFINKFNISSIPVIGPILGKT
jgi:hypothetical protein